ncbi:hypothetical protein [Burkholderia cenocepacia]|uniref:hypothetical protein n=1 Tax=Burkholderia cenocepacia TaxID=95486 RepID=UPI001CF5EFD3|nr:hypothetical protein [Burkholderia cenocepacia]MCA8086318.1 hypothetical protein [Burkholderia cenocepacia]
MTFNLQGDAQYWYENVWDRYWESLSLIEQDVFVDERRSSALAYLSEEQWAEWIDAIRTRDARYRAKLREGKRKAGGGEASS